jgi:RHS repeat-associated protein
LTFQIPILFHGGLIAINCRASIIYYAWPHQIRYNFALKLLCLARFRANCSGDNMTFIHTLARWGRNLSRKQILITLSLVAFFSVTSWVAANFLSPTVSDPLSDQVGAIQADFKVNESGAATYNIKIYTPPGTAGVTPQLSLGYTSQGGNGVMGKGWAIGGTSGISRCRASRESGDFIASGTPVDGDASPISFTNSDRYCLDGQRLLEVSNATDSCRVLSGATVMSLRTEIESFQRVCAYTFNAVNGPRFFTVDRKDGSTSWYGDRTSNSAGEIGARTDGFLESNRQLANGSFAANATIASWFQTRFQDSAGNYIDYLYVKNPTQTVSTGVTGEVVLLEVKYTGKVVLPGQSGAASEPYASIKFNYGLAAQATTAYQSGARFIQSQRLQSVTVTNDAEVVRHYPLTYSNSATGSQVSLLKQIQECADASVQTCMRPTVFTWAEYSNEFATNQSYQTQRPWNNSTQPLLGVKFGDITGDGRQDAVYLTSLFGTHGVFAATNYSQKNPANEPFGTSIQAAPIEGASASLFPSIYINGNNTLNPGDNGWFLHDYDGDGLDDLVFNNNTIGKWVIWPATGNALNAFNYNVDLLANLPTPIPSFQDPTVQPVISDLNGDGLMDIVYFTNAGMKARLMEKSNGSFGWFRERSVNTSDVCQNIKNCSFSHIGFFRKNGFQPLNDFNGDSRADLFLTLRVTAANDNGLFLNTGNISSPPAPGVATQTAAKFVSFALTVNGVTDTEISFKRYAWWAQTSLTDRINFGDLNGDGLQDLLINNSGAISYQINNGNGFRPVTSMSGSLTQTGFSRTHLVDVNGDGRMDLVYPRTDNKFVARLADVNGNLMAETLLPGAGAVTNCVNSNPCLDKHIYRFTDLDNDGNLDYIFMRIASNDSTLRYVSKSRSIDEPRDVIITIRDGLDQQTQLKYRPLSNKDVYRSERNTRNIWNVGRASPVQDFAAPIYVVKEVASGMPTSANANNFHKTYYRYSGAKLQAGGRGLLGFAEITTFDPNFAGTTLATSTRYYQTFPFLGVPIDSVQRLIPSTSYDPYQCENIGLGCYYRYGQSFPALTGTVISRATFAYESYPAFNPGQQVPVQIRTVGSESESFDLVNGERTKRVNTAYTYDAWGNQLLTAVDTYTGVSNTNPVTVKTNNAYINDGVNWRLSRMVTSTVTHQRNGQSVSRDTAFDYDMAGASTGFLKAERISPNGLASQDMRKEYTLDAYGNRLGSFSCTPNISNCKSTTLEYSLWDNRKVHRYSRAEYDSRGRYLTGMFEPFSTPGQPLDSAVTTERKTQTVLSRDKYGEITHAKDVNGVSVVSQRSAMGREYWTWVQTLPNAVPGDSAQGIDSFKTYRYCGAAANQVLCPIAAKFREQVITDAAPKRWAYFDALKRPLLEITETFNIGVTGKDFAAVCKAYDANGRPNFVSDPFFLSASHSNGEPSFGGADPCANRAGTSTSYDVLGRPIKTIASNAGQTIMQYDRLITTTTNALNQTKTEEKNALGELLKVTDHLGFQTHYAYDGAGNLATVTRNAGRGDIVTSMGYDSLGRKNYMKDPDAGEWYYDYYPSGELDVQYNPADYIFRYRRYDIRGRVVWTGSKNRNDIFEAVNYTTYDTATNGVGQMACSSTDSNYPYRRWQGDATKGPAWSECKQYDSMGRTIATTTGVDATSYSEAVRYDALGRPYKQMDATGNWVKTEFNARGMSVRTCQSSDADTDPNCAANVPSTYAETLETDARGHVVKEQRGGTAAMQVTRNYDALTGALTRTCVGNTCQIVDEAIAWDVIGNVQSRDIAGEYREEYRYDGLNRLSEARFSRIGATTYAAGSQPISAKQTYDALGNLCSKMVSGSEIGYQYAGASGCGLNGLPGYAQGNLAASPHAVTTSATAGVTSQYQYDSHGNQITADRNYQGGDRFIDYTANEQAYQINEGRLTTQFWYTPDNRRFKRLDSVSDVIRNIDPPPTGPLRITAPISSAAAPVISAAAAGGGGTGTNPQITKTITVGNVEIITAPNGVVTTRRTVAGVLLQETVNNVSVNRYLVHNFQGSVIRIVDAAGNVVERFDYAPFGERRGVTENFPNGAAAGSSKTLRGYTGHEMLDGFSIVHMNGRIYDSAIGRFLQADPVVEDPSNGQNFNRYTYVWNNPLAYTDPSGYSSFKQFFRSVAGAFISMYLPGASIWGNAANGAFANISSGFLGGVISSGSLRGGLAGAFSNGTMYALSRDPMEEAVTPSQSNDSYMSGEGTSTQNTVLNHNGRDSHGERGFYLTDAPAKYIKGLVNPNLRGVTLQKMAQEHGFNMLVKYSDIENGTALATTDSMTAEVTFYKDAFLKARNYYDLLSTMFHESIHIEQIMRYEGYGGEVRVLEMLDSNVRNLWEYEAHTRSSSNENPFIGRTSAADKANAIHFAASYLNALNADNAKLAASKSFDCNVVYCNPEKKK